ncbi:MAG: hypothetical protein JWO24_4171 [Rhodospirillales bacterium]|jgi:hypothetical protein|nr:hypothetical protein [Rhodospirillales bacterium]
MRHNPVPLQNDNPVPGGFGGFGRFHSVNARELADIVFSTNGVMGVHDSCIEGGRVNHPNPPNPPRRPSTAPACIAAPDGAKAAGSFPNIKFWRLAS